MGRSAKYFTQAEKDAGARQRKKEAASTECFQSLRKAQNHRAYQIRKASAPPKPPKVTLPAFSVPALSAELVALADFLTPQSRHFQLASQSSEVLDGTNYADMELAKWDRPPPYNQPPPQHPGQLADALHGYRLRCQREEEDCRLHRYKTTPLPTFASEVHAELMHHHRRWKELQTSMVGLSGQSVDGHFGLELLRWGARRICQLEKDLASLRKGSDTFLCLYVDRWS
ncbi:hypothetical protein B0H34DRAFT_464902 [Crassisporium funariophilum]|nr:hypothetical protein B0H34DRAFT_727118 [Crassisporium funariophilum]KAF8156515.1 hypothetical protein B0H34DRAFT_464902 [Crassisporium funariophilum]